MIARPGGFLFSELAPAHPPLAFAVTPPGRLDYALTRISNARPGGVVLSELAPAHPPLAFAVTPPGGLDYVLRTSAMGPGGFCFSGKLDSAFRFNSWVPRGRAFYLSLVASRA